MSDIETQRLIANLVPEGSRVLDLGCGDGAMLDPVSYTHLTLPTNREV